MRFKFRCESRGEVEHTAGAGTKTSYTTQFSPVYSTEPDSPNKVFWDATPGGALHLNMTSTAPFVVGKSYYLDLTIVED